MEKQSKASLNKEHVKYMVLPATQIKFASCDWEWLELSFIHVQHKAIEHIFNSQVYGI